MFIFLKFSACFSPKYDFILCQQGSLSNLTTSNFSKFLLTDIEMIMLGIGGEPVVTVG